MPCRPSAYDEACDLAEGNAPLVAMVDDFDQQRSKSLQLLNRLLELPVAPPVFRQMAAAIVYSEYRTQEIYPSGDPRLDARRRARKAEEHLCVARHSLLQFVAFMPPDEIKPYAEMIEIERLKHLSHRHADFAAELGDLERRIQAAVPKLPSDQLAPSAAAELARLRAEVVRLKSFSPSDLLASRNFSTGHSTCPACARFLPILPGLDSEKVSAIAAELGNNNRIGAVSLVRSATGLGLKEAKFYIDCPHVVPGVPAVQSTASGSPRYLCPTCFYEFPLVSGITASTLSTVLELLTAEGKTIAAIKAVQAATNWDTKAAKEYVQCPHRAP